VPDRSKCTRQFGCARNRYRFYNEEEVLRLLIVVCVCVCVVYLPLQVIFNIRVCVCPHKEIKTRKTL